MKTIVADIPSYDTFIKGDQVLKAGCPWLTFGAIIALEQIVNPKWRVLEFGSGGSTVFWANNCQSVKSFETDSQWFTAVKNRIQSFTNVQIILANFEEILIKIKKETDNYYDIVLIDSNPNQTNRLALANAAASKVKTNGWMVIDNYLRHGMSNFDYSLWDVYTFDDFRFSGRGTRICKKR